MHRLPNEWPIKLASQKRWRLRISDVAPAMTSILLALWKGRRATCGTSKKIMGCSPQHWWIFRRKLRYGICTDPKPFLNARLCCGSLAFGGSSKSATEMQSIFYAAHLPHLSHVQGLHEVNFMHHLRISWNVHCGVTNEKQHRIKCMMVAESMDDEWSLRCRSRLHGRRPGVAWRTARWCCPVTRRSRPCDECPVS